MDFFSNQVVAIRMRTFESNREGNKNRIEGNQPFFVFVFFFWLRFRNDSGTRTLKNATDSVGRRRIDGELN